MSKHNYGLSGAGVQMIWNYNFETPMRRGYFPKRINIRFAIASFLGTGMHDSPDVDILKKLKQEGISVITLDYPGE